MRIDQRVFYPREDGDFDVRTNPREGGGHFAIITLDERGDLEINIESPEDAGRLMAAAAQARAMLLVRASGQRHPYKLPQPPEAPGHWLRRCDTCGAIESSPIHQAPEPEPAGAPSAAEVCAAHHPQGRQS